MNELEGAQSGEHITVVIHQSTLFGSNEISVLSYNDNAVPKKFKKLKVDL